jgi:hypothetical protein
MPFSQHLSSIYHFNTQYAKLLQYLQPSSLKLWAHGLWKIIQSCNKIFTFSGLVHRGMKASILFLLQTSRKHSPWFLLEYEMFLQFSVVQFLAATYGSSSRQTINSHCLLAALSPPYSLVEDYTENISLCMVASWSVAPETCLQRRCHGRPHRQHRVAYCSVCICCLKNVFIVHLHSDDRLFSFHYSAMS